MAVDPPDLTVEQRLASLEALTASHTQQLSLIRDDVRVHEKWIDTFLATAWWKRLVFLLDGWSGHRLVTQPRWRPWRRWWVS